MGVVTRMLHRSILFFHEAEIMNRASVLLVLTCAMSLAGCMTAYSAERSIVLINGTLIDGTGGQPLPEAVVIIKAGRIVEVGTRSTLGPPEGSTVVDARGGTILPGFINSHVHGGYDERTLRNWAQAGVTTVRDLAAYPPYSSYTLRDALNGDPLNARLVASGPQMTAVNGFVPSGYRASIFVGSPEEGAREGNRILDAGADALKVMMESNWGYPSMSVETARAIVKAAHARGKRAVVHVSLCRDAERALQVDADELAHMAIDELSPDLAKRIAEAGIIWIPTMEVWKGLGLGNLVVRNLRVFVDAGGTVALGTDFGGASFPFDPGMPMKELGWMREAGMTSMQIIVAATRNAAEACGLASETGTIEAGKAADFIVVEGDPLSGIDALSRVRWVIHCGTIIRKP
jgi:imidazolonepropionase-like amidohydrolase